jgi:hypothetical protein
MQRARLGVVLRSAGPLPNAGVRDGPGSAKQHFVLHRVRDTCGSVQSVTIPLEPLPAFALTKSTKARSGAGTSRRPG